MTPPVKNRNPRSNSSYGPNSSYGSKSSYRPNFSRGSNSSKGSKSSYEHHRANVSVSQGRAKGYEYAHYASNHYVHKSLKNYSAYSYAYPNTLMWNEVDWLLCHLSLMELAEWWTLCTPSDVGGEEKELISYEGSCLQTNLNVWRLCWRPECLKGCKLIMKKWILISHVLILLYLLYYLMKLMSYSSLMKYMSS